MSVRWLAAMASVLMACGVCAGQEGVDELARRVARLSERAADADRDPEARRADARRAIELRAELIARAGEDPRRGTWMIDQAAALLSRLGEDASDTAVLLGAALPAQRERVGEASRRARELLERAGGALESGARALESEVDVAGAARLRRSERDVRLAFFEGRSCVLGAALASGGARQELARRVLGALSGMELEGAAEASRLTNLGLAHLLAGRAEVAGDTLESALELAWAGRAPRPVWCEAAGGAALAEAARGRVDEAVRRLDVALLDEPVVAGGRADAALAFAVLGARARVLIEAGRAPEAFDRHVALLEEGLAGLDAEASRSIVMASMARAAAGIEDLSALPAAVAFARAIDLSGRAGGRKRAVELLWRVADRDDAGGVGADALWELGVLLVDEGGERAVRGVEALTRLAREHPGSGRAGRALEAALAYARSLTARGVAGAEGVYEEALTVAMAELPEIDDRSYWLMERARRALRADRLDAALDSLERIGPGDERAEEAMTLYGAAVRRQIDRLWGELRAARAEGDAARVRSIAAEGLVPLASRAVVLARERGLGWVSSVRADLADARTELGQPGARVLYQRLLADEERVPGGEARLRLGLGRSLLIAGERERAFAALRRASELMGRSPGDSEAARERFWMCWTLLLEMLSAANEEGSRSGTILGHVVRLETIDPSLGGAPWRGRIEAVRASAR